MSKKQQGGARDSLVGKNSFSKKARIRDLDSHPTPYVTITSLADYWGISRKMIYKQIDAGTLDAVRFGPRLYRIKTSEARRFERSAKLSPGSPPYEAKSKSRRPAKSRG